MNLELLANGQAKCGVGALGMDTDPVPVSEHSIHCGSFSRLLRAKTELGDRVTTFQETLR